jgi:transposase
MVHLNSAEQWRQCWNKLGLAGLYEGRHTGRPKKWSPQQRQILAELAQSDGGSVVALLHQIDQRKENAPISESTATRHLKEMNFSYKRYCYSLKKSTIKKRSIAPAM